MYSKFPGDSLFQEYFKSSRNILLLVSFPLLSRVHGWLTTEAHFVLLLLISPYLTANEQGHFPPVHYALLWFLAGPESELSLTITWYHSSETPLILRVAQPHHHLGTTAQPHHHLGTTALKCPCQPPNLLK